MPMTQPQFEALVARLERKAARSPKLYRLTLGAFATLGYLYIFAILAALTGVAAALVVAIVSSKAYALVKILIPIVIFIGIIARTLWVKIVPPTGVPLKRREYPELFSAIDDVRRVTRAPLVHEVLLTNELNAAVVQVPRLGAFGWQKNYLVLGLPLLEMLSLPEFKAVLAHEFGHLSGAHGRFGAWIYRLRTTWGTLASTLQEGQRWGKALFGWFFNWYSGRFLAYSFVQARAQEYEADRLAAVTVGAAPLATALVRLNLKGQELERSYWPSILKRADDEPTPRGAPYRGLASPERRSFMPEVAEQLRQALEHKTSTADTHPCLRERLAALGSPASVPTAFGVSAGDALLGAKRDALAAHFDAQWESAVGEWWRGRHEHVKTSRARLAALTARPQPSLNDAELCEYALLLEELGDENRAFELMKQVVLEHGAKGGAKFAYARMLLKRGDETAIALLDEVMRDSPEATLPACEVIAGYLHARGREAEAKLYVDRYIARRNFEHEVQSARAKLLTTDKWLPPTLSPASLQALTATLAKHSGAIKRAYVVRKQMPDGAAPLHVVGIVRRTRFIENIADRRELLQGVAQEIRTGDDLLFISLTDNDKGFHRAFKKTGARIEIAKGGE